MHGLVKQSILSIKKIGPVSQVSLVKNPTSYSYLMLANAADVESNEELVEKIERNQDYSNVKNFWFNRSNSIIKNPTRPLIEDIDELSNLMSAGDYEKFTKEKKH